MSVAPDQITLRADELHEEVKKLTENNEYSDEVGRDLNNLLNSVRREFIDTENISAKKGAPERRLKKLMGKFEGEAPNDLKEIKRLMGAVRLFAEQSGCF
ncbi:MAG: hypothetical protein BRC25_02650 [Parcubacteria group bacterium SW_6_46_9]|nr:MAG: hypothetical protein BRC25_02650 [Parcubacteria group bacterium SW_6_46_9]